MPQTPAAFGLGISPSPTNAGSLMAAFRNIYAFLHQNGYVVVVPYVHQQVYACFDSRELRDGD